MAFTRPSYPVNRHQSQDDVLGKSAADAKAFFDQGEANIKAYETALLSELEASTDGASGADSIGMTQVDGLSGQTVQAVVEDLHAKAMHLSGAETVTGAKTFSVSPKVPAPTQDEDAVPKSYAAAKTDVYRKSEIDAKIDMTAGAPATINGIANPGGDWTFEDGGSNTILVQTDSVNKKVKLSATGSSIPAAHATQHASGGNDPVTPASIGAAGAIHAARHASGSADPIAPADIGAAGAIHTHAATDITSGAFPVANGGTGQTSLEDTTYTIARYRASALVNAETDPTTNGIINWTYE